MAEKDENILRMSMLGNQMTGN